MSVEWARVLPVVTTVMSIPLFFSYPIKYALVPEGLLFILLFTWGLLGAITVPILLVAECIVVILLVFTDIPDRRVLFVRNLLAICLSLVAEMIFLMVRSAP